MTFSFKAAVSGFGSDFAGSLAAPKTYPARGSGGFWKAGLYFLVLFTVSCLLYTVIQTAPVAWAFLGGDNKMESAFDNVPNFEIVDGKLNITDNVTQPIKVEPNFIIDTTGKTTEVPVDKNGEGILITEDGIISKNPGKEEKTYFKNLEGMIKNKQDLVAFMKNVLLITVPLMMVFILFASVFIFSAASCFSVVVYLAIALIAAKSRGKELKPVEAFSRGLYALSPVLAMGVVGSAVNVALPQVGAFWFMLLGILWGATMVALADS